MIIYILISILSLVVLVALHELGHFLVARKLGVKVEEFGIGIPPRIFARKIGETVYSLNILPIGAFVKIYGEGEKIKDERSFSEKTVLERALILLGGVIAFWIVAFFLLIFIGLMGAPTPIADEIEHSDARIVLLGTEKNSPARDAGIKPGDIVKKLSTDNEEVLIDTIGSFRNFLGENQGKEITALIQRGENEKELKIISNEENGVIGVYLERVVDEKYSFYEAPIFAAKTTVRYTFNIVSILGGSAVNVASGEDLPPGVQVVGPLGIVKEFFFGALERGVVDYLQVLVVVSISLAVFNLLPIPALDGGRLMFLVFEKIKGRPINEKLEQNLIVFSFLLLLVLFVLVTFYDIKRYLGY